MGWKQTSNESMWLKTKEKQREYAKKQFAERISLFEVSCMIKVKGSESMIYTIEEIKEICLPIFLEKNLKKVYLFGSYARDMATNTSDLDFLIDGEGSSLKTLFDQIALQLSLERVLEKEVDLITVNAVNSEINQKKSPGFKENIQKDLVVIYDRDERTTSISQNLNSN